MKKKILTLLYVLILHSNAHSASEPQLPPPLQSSEEIINSENKGNSFWDKTLNFFGNISYSLYLLHPLVGVATINVLSHTFFLSWQKPFVILIGLLAALVSSYITYISIEKRPQLLSKRLTYK